MIFIYTNEEIVMNRSVNISIWGKQLVIKKTVVISFQQYNGKSLLDLTGKTKYTEACDTFDDDSLRDWIEPSIHINVRL